MDDITDTLPRTAGSFPPPVDPAITAVKPWPGQISQASPMLPTATYSARPTTTEMHPFASAMYDSPAQPRHRSRGRSGARRAMSWLLLLAVLGGTGYAGVRYGPEAIESFTNPDAANGPAAPLVYPMPTAAPATVRTAMFTVSEPDPFGGTQNYEVTADFESGIAQVVIPRTDAPNIEMLMLWDQAFIRRIDEPTWYRLPRGDFPIDFSLGRARWVHTLDELLPPATRQFATIDQATESSVGTVAARRLVVAIDAVSLLQAQVAAEAAPVDGAPPAPPSPLPHGISVQYGLDGVDSITMEIWVDDSGIVRQVVFPAELGGETITVTSVSPVAWEPAFPTADETQPLTAEALFRLGL